MFAVAHTLYEEPWAALLSPTDGGTVFEPPNGPQGLEFENSPTLGKKSMFWHQ